MAITEMKPAAPLRTVHKDSKSGKVFFYDKEKELAQWNDPREPTVIMKGELQWVRVQVS